MARLPIYSSLLSEFIRLYMTNLIIILQQFLNIEHFFTVDFHSQSVIKKCYNKLLTECHNHNLIEAKTNDNVTLHIYKKKQGWSATYNIFM